MAQPSLDDSKMWTIDDIAALKIEIKNPLREARVMSGEIKAAPRLQYIKPRSVAVSNTRR